MDAIRISALAQGAGPAFGLPQATGNTAMEAARGFAEMLGRAETQSVAAVTTGADPHDLMTSIAESRLAIETVVAMRDRAVESYQEILRMPV